MSEESIFVYEGELLTPTEHARGPWDPEALHGGAPAALIASAFERIEPGQELPFARLSFEFLRPVPMAPLRLETDITRPGRRVQTLHAELTCEGAVVCRATALRVAAAPSQLPPAALVPAREQAVAALAPPEEGHPVHFALDDLDRKSFAASVQEMRFLTRAPVSNGDGDKRGAAGQPTGTATVWMRLRHPVLPGRPLTPLASLAGIADSSNGVAAALRFDEYLFINADLTITLNRRPQGEWIGLDARTLLHPGGIAWAESVLHDEHGPVGRAEQALVVQPR